MRSCSNNWEQLNITSNLNLTTWVLLQRCVIYRWKSKKLIFLVFSTIVVYCICNVLVMELLLKLTSKWVHARLDPQALTTNEEEKSGKPKNGGLSTSYNFWTKRTNKWLFSCKTMIVFREIIEKVKKNYLLKILL